MEKQIEMFPGSPRGGCNYFRGELDPARVPRACSQFSDQIFIIRVL